MLTIIVLVEHCLINLPTLLMAFTISVFSFSFILSFPICLEVNTNNENRFFLNKKFSIGSSLHLLMSCSRISLVLQVIYRTDDDPPCPPLPFLSDVTMERFRRVTSNQLNGASLCFPCTHLIFNSNRSFAMAFCFGLVWFRHSWDWDDL